MIINPRLLTVLKEVAITYLPELKKLTENGVKAIKESIEINQLNQKNKKIKLDIDKCFMEIGKEICKSTTNVNNLVIKESQKKINQLEKEIEKNLKEIEELKQKAKEEGASESDINLLQKVLEQVNEKKISLTVPSKKGNKTQTKKTQPKKTKTKKTTKKTK